LSVSIRLAVPEDAPIIAGTHCASWRTTYPGLVPDSVIAQWADERARTEGWRKNLTEAPDEQTVWIAFDDTNSCLGFAAAGIRHNEDVQTDGQIRALYLRKEAQGRGIGRALIETAFSYLRRECGFESACVEVLKNNPAEAFYQRLGARHVFTTVFEMGGHPLTEHVYVWERIPGKG
jgi:ribosomal protein S18 acetylase RimI-like enzyme